MKKFGIIFGSVIAGLYLLFLLLPIVVSPIINMHNADIVKAIEKVANIQNTNGISEVEFTGWLKRECEVEKVSIEQSAVSLYYKACGNDLEMAKNEIDKAINYVGKNGLIRYELHC